MSQERLDESQIDAGFKSLFRQLAGPVSAFLTGSREKDHVGVRVSVCLCQQDMEISITELQTILNRIISKRWSPPVYLITIM